MLWTFPLCFLCSQEPTAEQFRKLFGFMWENRNITPPPCGVYSWRIDWTGCRVPINSHIWNEEHLLRPLRLPYRYPTIIRILKVNERVGFSFINLLKFLSRSCFLWRFGTVSLKLMMSHFNQKVGVVLQSLRRSIRSIQPNKQDCKMARKHHSVQCKQMSFEVMGKVSDCTQTRSDWLAVQTINMFTPHSYWFGKYFPALV